MVDEKKSPERGMTLAALGAGLLIVVCCAGPALIVGGALGALGGVLRNPWLIASGVVGLLAAVGYTARRHVDHSHRGTDNCCPPVSSSTDQDAQDSSHLGVTESQHRQ